MSARKQTRLKTGLLPALGASLLLAGCMVGPDYVRPTSTLPEQYKETTAESGAPAGAKAPVNPEWWTLFNDGPKRCSSRRPGRPRCRRIR